MAGELILPSEPSAKSLTIYPFPEQRVRGSSFPAAIVLLGLLLMLPAATRLRAAATAIEISEEIYRGRRLAGPAHNTVRNHLRRLGLDEINRAKAVLSDWVGIVDHTIQVGHQLCMVVLGILFHNFNRSQGRYDVRTCRCSNCFRWRSRMERSWVFTSPTSRVAMAIRRRWCRTKARILAAVFKHFAKARVVRCGASISFTKYLG